MAQSSSFSASSAGGEQQPMAPHQPRQYPGLEPTPIRFDVGSSSVSARHPLAADLREDEAGLEALWQEPRRTTSARRYQPPLSSWSADAGDPYQPSSPVTRSADVAGRPTPIPPRRHQQPARITREAGEESSPVQQHPVRGRRSALVFIGLGMLAMIGLWLCLAFLVSWWSGWQEDLRYGYPRTFQVDAVVGHHDSAAHPSHFLALNEHQQIIVIEFPGGDVTQARTFVGPVLYGPGQDLTPVTLTFRDVNGDGKPDMLVSAGASVFTWLNDKGTFRPARPGEVAGA
jgi:hypothetical protein